MKLQQRIERVLDTEKRENETWHDTFERLQPLGRVDMKATIEMLAEILEELDYRDVPEPLIFEGDTLVDKPDPFDRSLKDKETIEFTDRGGTKRTKTVPKRKKPAKKKKKK